MQHQPGRAVLRAARRAARASDAPMVLAVSGGLDSMALLHAMASVARRRIAVVATFDHGTGPAATAAASHVARSAAALGLPCVIGRLDSASRATDGREAAWRTARHRFLHEVARPFGARVVVAHTEDDLVETVLLRVLRGSGTRGLAALYAPSAVVRPFVHLRRAELAAFVRSAGVRWREDPSNRSRELARNRVRHDLLPALRGVDPDIDASLLRVARAAAEWRASVERFVDAEVRPTRLAADVLSVDAAELAGYDTDSLAMLWGALAGRVGLALDRRGTRRLAAFTTSSPCVGTIPLAGGWSLDAHAGRYLLTGPRSAEPPAVLPRDGGLDWGGFAFRVIAESATVGAGAGWTASLPVGAIFAVRRWGAGDRLGPVNGGARRRVKRYLSDAGIHGQERAGWPVVVTRDDGEVVWIPGVRRSDAATERSGGPVRHYVCERIDR